MLLFRPSASFDLCTNRGRQRPVICHHYYWSTLYCHRLSGRPPSAFGHLKKGERQRKNWHDRHPYTTRDQNKRDWDKYPPKEEEPKKGISPPILVMSGFLLRFFTQCFPSYMSLCLLWCPRPLKRRKLIFLSKMMPTFRAFLTPIRWS